MVELEINDKTIKFEEVNQLINEIFDTCFEEEKLDKKILIEVMFESEQKVWELNLEYRGVDRTTDVLSFPMFDKDFIDQNICGKQLENIDILGTIIINLKKVEEQAKEYGHSKKRELSYLLVHGFYHLMGYDHIEETDKKQMRQKEDFILKKLNITRGDENGNL